MEPHVPAGPIHSLRDFLIHLGIVTVGILIALGLEQVVEAHHRSTVAKAAVQGFRREITDDMEQVKDILQAMPMRRDQVNEAIMHLAEVPAASARPPSINYPGINFNLVSSASWDTAIATQALNDLPYETVKRYAEAFGVLRVFQDQERSSITIWQDMRRFGADTASLTKEERVTLVEELRRYESYTFATELVGKGTLKTCMAALQ